ncbi:hypothetical protein [Saccharopolyspora griseoalba]|uniref:Uncharacterized protein n=1 Tax=Saccharopolyspora griseoalba TaxID=1431848 RepID=A0ABW2LKD7_9PSEU
MLKLLGATPLRLVVVRAGESGLFLGAELLGESDKLARQLLPLFMRVSAATQLKRRLVQFPLH